MDSRTKFGSRRGEFLNIAWIIDADRDSRAARECSHAIDFDLAGNLVADEDVAYSSVHHDFSFGDLLTANTNRAGCNLHVGNCRAFVRLGMRPQVDVRSRSPLLHPTDVSLQGIQVDQQRRSVDFGYMRANRGRSGNHIAPLSLPEFG
jgi:hypothetical protein